MKKWSEPLRFHTIWGLSMGDPVRSIILEGGKHWQQLWMWWYFRVQEQKTTLWFVRTARTGYEIPLDAKPITSSVRAMPTYPSVPDSNVVNLLSGAKNVPYGVQRTRNHARTCDQTFNWRKYGARTIINHKMPSVVVLVVRRRWRRKGRDEP